MRDRHLFLLFSAIISVPHIHSSEGGPVDTTVSCSPSWQAVGGQCFWISEVQLNWNSAQQECEQMGGSLAEPEYLHMLRTYLNSNKLHGDYWLGGMRDDSAGSWKWLSGRPLIDAFQEGRGNRGFKCLDFQSNMAPSLNDYGCDNEQFFICEGSAISPEVPESDNSVPSRVANVEVTSVKSMEIDLAWEAPNDPDTEIEMYEVLYYEEDNDSTGSSIQTTKQEASLPGLRQRTKYGFQVRAKSAYGWGEYSSAVYKWTGNIDDPDLSECSGISTCSSCVSNPSCDWCLVDHRCTNAYANTCSTTDVVVYAHYPNGTNVGKRFRNGPSFCPRLIKPSHESDYIQSLSSDKKSSFRLQAKGIPEFMQNFTCHLNWEDNQEPFHIESLGVKQKNYYRENEIKEISCEDMDIPETNTSEVMAKFTLKFNGNVVESPDDKYALIVNCGIMASKCEDCALYSSPYHCGWCIPTGTCLRSGKCSGSYNDFIDSEREIKNCPASPNITTSLEWCESPSVSIGSECFFISNIGHEREEVPRSYGQFVPRRMEGQTSNDMTWNDAQRFCQDRGENLAQPYKIKAITEFLAKSENQDAIKSKYWIGGRRKSPNSYVWTSGDILRRDWISGDKNPDYNCLQYGSRWGNGYLFLQNCSVPLPWICEKTIPESLV